MSYSLARQPLAERTRRQLGRAKSLTSCCYVTPWPGLFCACFLLLKQGQWPLPPATFHAHTQGICETMWNDRSWRQGGVNKRRATSFAEPHWRPGGRTGICAAAAHAEREFCRVSDGGWRPERLLPRRPPTCMDCCCFCRDFLPVSSSARTASFSTFTPFLSSTGYRVLTLSSSSLIVLPMKFLKRKYGHPASLLESVNAPRPSFHLPYKGQIP